MNAGYSRLIDVHLPDGSNGLVEHAIHGRCQRDPDQLLLARAEVNYAGCSCRPRLLIGIDGHQLHAAVRRDSRLVRLVPGVHRVLVVEDLTLSGRGCGRDGPLITGTLTEWFLGVWPANERVAK